MTTATRRAAASQLSDALDVALAGPAGDLLGVDLAQQIRTRIADRVDLLVDQLAQDDDRLSAATALDIVNAIWPKEVDHAWWRTPLGRLCARPLAVDGSDAVSLAAAAQILGVGSRSTVQTYLERGYLNRHPDGGVTRASVLARLIR